MSGLTTKKNEPCVSVVKTKWVVLGVILIALLGVAYWLWRKYKKQKPEPPPTPPGPPVPPPPGPLPYIGFSVDRVLGKTGRLFVAGRGYVSRKSVGSSTLEYSGNQGNAIEWIWREAEENGVRVPDTYRFEEANSRNPAGDEAVYLSISDNGVGFASPKGVKKTGPSEHFQIAVEAPGSRRFHLIGKNIGSNSFITDKDVVTFETTLLK